MYAQLLLLHLSFHQFRPVYGCNSIFFTLHSCCYQPSCWSNNKNIRFGPCGTGNLIVWTGAKSIQNLFFLTNREHGDYIVLWRSGMIQSKWVTLSARPRPIRFYRKGNRFHWQKLGIRVIFLNLFLASLKRPGLLEGVMSSQESLMIHVLALCSKYKMCLTPSIFSEEPGWSFSAS